jgi:RimK family alpha-L-glutamate ligase
MADVATLAPADVWLLVRNHPVPLMRSADDLVRAFGPVYGDRFAVWHTDELVFGVRDGQLFLRTLAGLDVPAPKVACIRQLPGSMTHNREVTLLRHLERMGTVLINPLDAHLACGNKVWQLQDLALAGLPVPDTLSYGTSPLDGVVRMPGLEAPCVVKSVVGHKGKRVFLAPDTQLLHDLVGSLAQDVPLLFQDYVAASHGRDLRVIVVDGEPVAAQIRTATTDALASNLGRGGTATLCPGRYPEAEALAVQAAQALGLVIAGVDLLFISETEYLVCEVNAVPGWRPQMTEVVPAILRSVARRLER